MIAFFLDTCANNMIISIIKNEEIIYYLNEKNDTNLSSRIMVEIDKAFKSTGLTPQDLDRIYVVNGPGSFTGIRVGVTIAKLWNLTLSIPIIKISELEVMASESDTTCAPIIDARRGYVFGAIYDENLNPILTDRYISLDEIKEEAGDINFISSADNVDIMKLIKKHENDEQISHRILNPNYLKRVEAEEKLQ